LTVEEEKEEESKEKDPVFEKEFADFMSSMNKEP